jgi:peptidoglycan/xylan/chitin deacetylase (PgdA/CDA1 family)
MQLSIYNYHYYREEVYNSGIYPINEESFRRQLEYLSRHYIFISQKELVHLLKSKTHTNKNYCLITFDDGLKEQMRAFSVLKELGIPAIFYVSSDPLQNKKCVDVHKIHYIRSEMSDVDLFEALENSFGISSYKFNLNVLRNQYLYDDDLSRKIKYYLNFVLKSKQREDFINKIFFSLINEEAEFAKSLYMSKEDVLELDKAGMFGTHSSTHQPLANLVTEEKIEKDIIDSINYFDSLGVKNIKSISYPYGGATAVNKTVTDVSKNLGFEFGLTMMRGVNCNQEIFDFKFNLKRNSCSDLNNDENYE